MNLKTKIAALGALLTGIEVPVLVKWLLLALARSWLAAPFLFVGVAIEELVRFRGIKGRLPTGRELTLVGLGVLVETITWIVPFATHADFGAAFLFIFGGLALEHAIIDSATSGAFALGRVLDFSAVEAAGGALWLTYPTPLTIGVLAAASVLEHVQGLRKAFGLR